MPARHVIRLLLLRRYERLLRASAPLMPTMMDCCFMMRYAAAAFSPCRFRRLRQRYAAAAMLRAPRCRHARLMPRASVAI